ncbi:hypothetical protein Spico_0242 [Parasphaerochaeta coccoides DSM 17374]|uniref:Uncharacterized protein n=1 Tax=Parasphaerochaeta coccoides (strain ATCC BAA-1237 / DSM 17374 / SPN1) TaxID=760011 RepID=F4GKR7_PARC1|nr:hypothetical protein Spico_0242 [Parasphaerochaeta coccoides DSM 17374]
MKGIDSEFSWVRGADKKLDFSILPSFFLSFHFTGRGARLHRPKLLTKMADAYILSFAVKKAKKHPYSF